ncbi:hypothetical protein C2S52_023078 [Perilla frutescens var. hirtella]|nr:hypothetical protein C2S52_023078 [Perilla frutescens var. hirtella]
MADTTEKERTIFDSNPNQCLNSVLLNEYSYLSWSRAINLALGSRSKLSFISDKNGVPDADSPEDLAETHQGNLSFIQHLGNLKAKWNELDLYRPHTTDATTLLKRAEEDKLPSFQMVCNAIQREEVRRKVMNAGVVLVNNESNVAENRAFAATRPDLKCNHCVKIGRHGIGHVQEKCWILHPELKLKFNEDGKFIKKSLHTSKANVVDSNLPIERPMDLSTNPLYISSRRPPKKVPLKVGELSVGCGDGEKC